MTKCDLRCFVALAGILPAKRYVPTCRSNTAPIAHNNKEYFADKECHTCGKKGHPSRCCPRKKGKA